MCLSCQVQLLFARTGSVRLHHTLPLKNTGRWLPGCRPVGGHKPTRLIRLSLPSAMTTMQRAPSLRTASMQHVHGRTPYYGRRYTSGTKVVVQAASGKVERSSISLKYPDPCPSPSEAAREVLNGIAVEQYPEVEAVVEGTLPSWLSGSLLTNGGGDYSHMNHQYDGYAFVSKVRVADGRAWGSQRFLQTEAYKEYKKTGLVRYREFNKQPETSGLLDSLRQLAANFGPNGSMTDNACVALGLLGTPPPGVDRVVMAMTETPVGQYLINPDDISIVEKVKYDDGVPGLMTLVHGHRLSNGTCINFTRSFPNGGTHVITQDSETLRRTEIAYIPDRQPTTPSWMHDLAATDNYVALIEPPLYMSLSSLLFGRVGGAVSHMFMDWKPDDEVKVYLVPLDGTGTVRTFTCPSFFYMHIGNCFESGDGRTLYVDLAVYDNPDILLDLSLDTLRAATVQGEGLGQSYYKRLAIPLTEGADSRLEAPKPLLHAKAKQQLGTQQQQQQSADPLGSYCEFPVINFSYWGRPYKFAYSHSAIRPTTQGNAVSKINVQEGTAETWSIPGGAVGEPAFVARPGATAEDDGVVLIPGVGPDGKSFMAVLDAAKWVQVANVCLPYGTPHRFHGLWLEDVQS